MGALGGRDSKAIANRTSLGSGPMFGTVRWTYSLQYHFFGRSFSRFVTYCDHLGGPETGSEKKLLNGSIIKQTYAQI